MKIYTSNKNYYDLSQNLNLDENVEIISINEDNLNEVEYIINGRLTKQDFESMPNIKVVAIPFAGVNRMDLEEAYKRGIKVINTHIHSCFVAEKAVSLALGLLGKINTYHNHLKVGDWSNRNNAKTRLKWDSMHNKKVGIFGYGNIGQYIHKLLKPYNCDFYTIKRSKNYEGVNLVKDLKELVDVSDVIFISVPISSSTIGAFDEALLQTMQDKYLINIARGSVIVEEALYNALKNNTLKGFASDVWYEYPENDESLALPSKFPLHLFDNVLMSPHCASATHTAHGLMLEDVINKLVKIDNNEEVDYVDVEKNLLSSGTNISSMG